MKVWVARFRRATFEESAASATDADGSETDPPEMVRPFAPVMSP